MIRNIRTALILLCFLLPSLATSQAPWNINSTVLSTEGSASPGEAYVSVDIQLETYHLAAITPQQKASRVKEVLDALGVRRSQTRDFVLVAKVEMNGVEQPPQPIISLKADASTKDLIRSRDTFYRSPRILAAADRTIDVTLSVRDTSATQFNVKEAVEAVGEVIPSDSLVNAISKPFIGSALGAADKILGLAGSSNVSENVQISMGAGEGANKVARFEVIAPGGVALATIKVTLRASQSILGESASFDQYRPTPSSNASYRSVIYPIAGGVVSAIDPVHALSEYRNLVTNRTAAQTRAFCTQAKRNLLTVQQLTTHDAEAVIVEAIRDLSEGSQALDSAYWLESCFTRGSFNSRVADAGFELPTPDSLRRLDRRQKAAFGCWLTASPPSSCSPMAREAIVASLAKNLELSWIPTFIHIPTDYRITPREDFLNAVKGQFSSFRCAGSADGDLVLVAHDSIFRLDAHFQSGVIARIAFTPVNADAGSCNDQVGG